MTKKLSLSVLLLMLLSACAMHGTQFECKGGRGQRCTSVSKVNKMIDRGEINDESEELKPIDPVLSKPKPQNTPKRSEKKFEIWMPELKTQT